MEPGYFDGVGSQLSALAAAGAHQSTTRRPRMRLPRIAPGLALAGSLLVVVAVVGVVLAVRPDRQGGAATGGATTGRIDPSLVRNYAILRRPSVGTDRLPTDVLDRLTPTVRAQNGLLPSRSRRIPLPGQRPLPWQARSWRARHRHRPRSRARLPVMTTWQSAWSPTGSARWQSGTRCRGRPDRCHLRTGYSPRTTRSASRS